MKICFDWFNTIFHSNWKVFVAAQFEYLTNFVSDSEGGGSGCATPTQLNPVQRKKKPKRRSTGVVNLELDVSWIYSEFYFLTQLLK